MSASNIFAPEPEISPVEVAQNPFATGNFGGIIAESKRSEGKNPFETESHYSVKKPYASSSNPFNDQSFEQKDKISVGSGKLNPFETITEQPSVVNPFETKTEQHSLQSGLFEKKRDQPSNPFETSTHKSEK